MWYQHGEGFYEYKRNQTKRPGCIKNENYRDFLGGPVVKNPPSKAGDVGLIPGRGTKIPHAAEQLSLHAATTEPACSGVRAPQQRACVLQ